MLKNNEEGFTQKSFFLIFGGHQSLCEATDTTVLDFWWRLPWASKHKLFVICDNNFLQQNLFCIQFYQLKIQCRTYKGTIACYVTISSCSFHNVRR